MICPECDTEFKREDIHLSFDRDIDPEGPIDIEFECESCQSSFYAPIDREDLK